MSDQNHVLVTGGCGFLGRHVVSRLAAQGCHVTILDDLSAGAPLDTADASIKFVNGDIADPSTVRAVLGERPFDHVIHLAAIHFIPRCDADPRAAFMVNVVGTRNLVEALVPSSSLKSLVFASSVAVYAPSAEVLSEDADTVPMDIYGWSKLVCEDLVRSASVRGGWRAVCCRLSNLIGPGETNPHLFPEIGRQIARGEALIEVGNTTPRRNYLHVMDAADLFVRCIGLSGSDAYTINLGSGEEYSVADILSLFQKAAQRPVKFVEAAARKRKVDRPRLQPNTTVMRGLIGEPQRSVEDAIKAVLTEFALETQPKWSNTG
ncbi:NAD(P)-dependent oxidoreductase [Rhizobium sp. 007]|uniref:NAD-dependent epimerase/dehydratase family protein n=1 Tax=Rhizobium sp. 007 TaxID=2785056 RepID=UPI00188E5293|nr:NAD(P)-dependent oxidoreductase [Rhizobium sp. 007]QPB23942.1 NAD(P)-dependent oxidoreductase [Rhizobium sp. 007]